MLPSRLFPLIALSLLTCSPVLAQPGVLDLTELANYANQTRPTFITRNNTPGNNAITDAGATLGRVMFYDKRLSRNSTVSCSSCHQQAAAFGDTATVSTGVSGTTGRHSMRLINARFAAEVRFFWDERATSLEDQTTRPVRDHAEMGFSGTSGDPAFADLVVRLTAIEEYRVLFAATFGDAAITETRIQLALAQFVRSIQSFDSKYDVGRATAADNQPFANFTAQENAGKQLFLAPPGPPPNGGAGCAGCHRPPEFDIDPNSRNNGVTTGISGTDLTNTRSPTLRDLVGPGSALNGPLMHDGSFTTLGQVVNHYNTIPADNTNLDPRLRRPGGAVQNLNLTQQQRDNIAAFLLTLTGSSVYTDPKWSSPFDASGNLSLIIIPTVGMTLESNGDGSLRVATTAASGLSYALQASTDLSTWTTIATVAANATGVLEQNVIPASPSRAFYRYVYTPPAP